MPCDCKVTNQPLENTVNQLNVDGNTVINQIDVNDIQPDPIIISFDENNDIQTYIENLNVPDIIEYILENKYIVSTDNDNITLSIPFDKMQEDINFSFDISNIKYRLQTVIKIIHSEYKEITESTIRKMIGFSNDITTDKLIKITDKYIKNKNCKKLKKKYKKKIINIFKNDIYNLVENITLNLPITKLKYFLSIGYYLTNYNTKIKIPNYITNWYELTEFFKYINENNLILPKISQCFVK